MVTIIGIDPGLCITGFGVIRSDGNKHEYITSGCIRLGRQNLPCRLRQIFTNLSDIIDAHSPSVAAIEQVFMKANANSALKLGQARGAAITALVAHNIFPAEYSPRQIKKAVVGYGAADKIQVQQMVKSLLKLTGSMQEDAADALAVAIYHAHMLRRNL